MKEYLKYSLVFLFTFFLMSISVNAEEINKDDIPNSTYIIGTYMFTRNTNAEENYQGQLTTTMIMMASKTISENSIDKMIIYQKTARGKWINALTNEEVNVPDIFDIYYKDLSRISDKYRITYDLDGGIGSNPEIFTAQSETFTLNNPTKEGYVFIGWTGSNGDTPELEITIPKGTMEDLEYTANWTLYGDVDADGKVNSKDITLLRRYISGGYTLLSPVYIEAGDVNADGEIDDVDIAIIRKYIAGGYGVDKLPYDSGDKYTITYNLDDGEIKNVYKTYAEITLSYTLETPTKEGYVFIGWTGSNGNIPELEVTIPEGTTKDLEYTANWVLLGDVNGDGVISTTDVVYLLRYISGGYTLPSPVYIEAGDVNDDGEIDYVDAAIIQEYTAGNVKTLPYDSGDKYTITYNLVGGEIKNAYKTYAEITLPYTLETPTKEGYIFIGWTGSNGNTPELEVTIPEGTTKNLKYIANWLLYGDVNEDGEVNDKDVTLLRRYLSGDNVTINKLAGDVNTDGEIDDVDVAIIKKYNAGYDITLPYDSGDKYTITYNLDGGEIENAYKTYAEITLPYTLETPTKDGYAFMGWTGSNGDTPELEVTIPNGTTKNLEYTANWTVLED